ncbi:Major facilitator superfamily domain protein [Niveomyces insectorum RCEF 264]|uniref:Major facilitator superfamily domain protein n=1 Tax=Niveomyces insectorum RCEF 264 TaxID=1081102 RepID=A0A167RJB9_9HYPO|nr:Major facilitator superfamily domain protein [Niveomyces insectorum RCEF 264]
MADVKDELQLSTPDNGSGSHIEEGGQEKVPDEEGPKLDPHGLPLVPQPSKFKDDPLNWPRWLKWAVLLQVSFMAFLGPFNSAVPNPSMNLLSKSFHLPVVTVAYSTTTAIITAGVSPFLLVPMSNVWGRRPLCLLCLLVTIVSHIGTAKSTTFSALLGCRALNGIAFGGMMAVGTPVLNDMFFLHERGEMTGVYTIFITNGAHIAALCGGFLGQKAGWQWDFYMPAIVTSASLLVAIFLLPESLFSRGPHFLRERTRERTYTQMLFDFRGNLIPQRRLHVQDFFTSFYMLKYPSIALPFWLYTWSWTFLNILPAISMAKVYGTKYGFASGPIGLCTGIPLIIGSLIGELSGGKLSDIILYRLAKRNNGKVIPEHRLYLTWVSAFLGPTGMIIFGVCLQKNYGFAVPLVGLGVGVVGLQISSTCLYAYCSDCYRPQTPESGVLMNLSRGLSFVIGFFWSPMVERIGYDWTWSALALVLFAFWLPILGLMIWGERWRKRLGEPSFHQFT